MYAVPLINTVIRNALWWCGHFLSICTPARTRCEDVMRCILRQGWGNDSDSIEAQ